MQTFVQLSPEEMRIIKNVYHSRAANVNTAFVVGFACMFLGIFFSFIVIGFPVRDNFLQWVIFVVFLIGLASLFSGIRRRKNNKRLFKTALEANRKEVVTGYLKQVEIISANRLRYHFTNFSKDVFLAIRPLGHLSIKEFQTLDNTKIELHSVSISPDEHLLLKVFYEEPAFSAETTVPLTAEDRNKLMPWSLPEYRVLAFVLLVVSLIMILVARFDPEVTSVTIGIAVFIILCVFIPRIVFVKMRRNKILLSTRITERIHIYVRAGKYSSRQIWYRIDNGLLEDHLRSDLKVGDTVHLSFVQKRNGSRGLLIEAKEDS